MIRPIDSPAPDAIFIVREKGFPRHLNHGFTRQRIANDCIAWEGLLRLNEVKSAARLWIGRRRVRKFAATA